MQCYGVHLLEVDLLLLQQRKRESTFKGMLKTADPPLTNTEKWDDVRERFTKQESFEVVTEESERVRIFKDYIKSLKVSLCPCAI